MSIRRTGIYGKENVLQVLSWYQNRVSQHDKSYRDQDIHVIQISTDKKTDNALIANANDRIDSMTTNKEQYTAINQCLTISEDLLFEAGLNIPLRSAPDNIPKFRYFFTPVMVARYYMENILWFGNLRFYPLNLKANGGIVENN